VNRLVYIKQVDVCIVRECHPFIMPISILREDILRFGQVAEVGCLALGGGEPTLHPDIDEMIAMCRSTNIPKAVSVITSGQLLHRMSDRFWRMTRKLEVNVYPKTMSGAQIVNVQNKAKENNINLKINPVSESYRYYRNISLDYGYVCAEDEKKIQLEAITTESLEKLLSEVDRISV